MFKKIVDACRTAYADEMALLVRRALSHISPVVNPQARAGSPTAPSAPSRPVPSSDLGYDFYKLQNQGQPVRCHFLRPRPSGPAGLSLSDAVWHRFESC